MNKHKKRGITRHFWLKNDLGLNLPIFKMAAGRHLESYNTHKGGNLPPT